jgi:hypothetical protein
VLIVLAMSLAMLGLLARRDGRMLCPLHEVRMRDFSGLIKHPRLSPSSLMLSRRKARSM